MTGLRIFAKFRVLGPNGGHWPPSFSLEFPPLLAAWCYHFVWMTREMEKWASDYASAFQAHLGIAAGGALSFARLYIALWGAGLEPRITSGYRDGAYQRTLQARWDAGDRTGLRVRPATNSLHSRTSKIGAPASIAVDMPCRDDKRGAVIAGQLGLGAGMSFSTPDPGHYYLLGGYS